MRMVFVLGQWTIIVLIEVTFDAKGCQLHFIPTFRDSD